MTLPHHRPSCRWWCTLDRRRRRLARDGLRLRRLTGTMDIRMVRHRRIRRRISSRRNRTEDFYETDDYDPNDSTFSDHYPALLDQTVETKQGDPSKLETVQVTRQERTLQQRKRKTSGQEQRKRQGETSWTMSLVPGTSLGSWTVLHILVTSTMSFQALESVDD